jgi:hypothetical protein
MNDDDQDPFEAITSLNTKAYDAGYKEGTIAGKKEAIRTGFGIGKTTSFNIASELGHYYGLCDLYRKEHDEKTSNHETLDTSSNAQAEVGSPNTDERVVKLASQICELIEKFDLVNCHEDSFSADLGHIRDKIKQFCSLTKYKNYFNKELLDKVKLSF